MVLFDLHDVCDLIRERIRVLDEEINLHAVETMGEALPEHEYELLNWRRALDVVREAARRE